MKKFVWAAAMLLSTGALAQGSGGDYLTVYNDNLVLVGEERPMDIPAGVHTISFDGIASTLDPTSVNVECPGDPGFRVLEQNYEYDLVSAQALLSRYLGQTITLLHFGGDKAPDLSVKLLSADGGRLVVEKQDGSLLSVEPNADLGFPKLPEGLNLKPSLRWKVRSDRSGTRPLDLTYLAGGMGWHADYTLLLNEKESGAGFDGWVTLDNHTGTTFPDAHLKLLAGEVNRVQQATPRMALMEAKAMGMGAPAPAFSEKALSDYHLYTLARTTTLQNNETKQIELLSAASMPVKKLYRYDGAGLTDWTGNGITDRYYGTDSGTSKVDAFLAFDNSKAAGLGMPLPAGKVRVYEKDDDGHREFLGEDSIGHTPQDEGVTVRMGTAFDLVGQRTQTAFTQPDAHSFEESFAITLKNHKDAAVKVDVVEHLYRYSNWKIVEQSQDFNRVDARTVSFPLSVPAGGRASVTYKVRYWWH